MSDGGMSPPTLSPERKTKPNQNKTTYQTKKQQNTLNRSTGRKNNNNN